MRIEACQARKGWGWGGRRGEKRNQKIKRPQQLDFLTYTLLSNEAVSSFGRILKTPELKDQRNTAVVPEDVRVFHHYNQTSIYHHTG